ncbi:hypothetical protein FDA94_10010 [Herbidospora galbida]|uniref:Uncharacterized protein n=1 Tax=Herbidospora galbida TaxID=2575442 RepID=A0A4U3MKW6_9ACTN|nr:hypothetical protein [Herbidospora galbida]TKK89262.1 hypothetical protein FDA94_10010 [Herbidospora galbida]
MSADKWTETLTDLAEAIRTSEIPGDLGITQVTLEPMVDSEGEDGLWAHIVMDGVGDDGWDPMMCHALSLSSNRLAAEHGLDHYVFTRFYTRQDWAERDLVEDGDDEAGTDDA